MTTQLITPEVTTPSVPGPSVPGPVRHRRIRNATIVASVAALIAAGSYGALETFGPDAQAPQPATAPTPNAQALTQNRDRIANLYGPNQATTRTPTAQALTQNRDNIANLYGPSQATIRTPDRSN